MRKIYVDMGPHAIERIRESLNIKEDPEAMLEKLNKDVSIGILKTDFLYVPELGGEIVLDRHEKYDSPDIFFGVTFKSHYFLGGGEEVNIHWYFKELDTSKIK